MILEELLLEAGVDFYRHGDELELPCPFCLERIGSDDMKRRLGVNIRKFKAHCFRCEWSADGLRGIAKELCEAFGLKYDLLALIKAERQTESYDPAEDDKPPKETGLPEGFERFSGSDDVIEQTALAYLKGRGVTMEQIKRHKIGYAAVGQMAYRIIFPVYGRNKRVYGFVGRDITGTQEKKYLNSYGSKLLWGAEMPAEAAVMCEGIMDALRVEQTLTGAAALADLGSTITSYQLAQLARYKYRVYLPDCDAAGIRAAIRLGDKCTEAGLSLYVAVPRILDGRDPGDMPLDELQEWAQTARLYGSTTKARLRIVKEA